MHEFHFNDTEQQALFDWVLRETNINLATVSNS